MVADRVIKSENGLAVADSGGVRRTKTLPNKGNTTESDETLYQGYRCRRTVRTCIQVYSGMRIERERGDRLGNQVCCDFSS